MCLSWEAVSYTKGQGILAEQGDSVLVGWIGQHIIEVGFYCVYYVNCVIGP